MRTKTVCPLYRTFFSNNVVEPIYRISSFSSIMFGFNKKLDQEQLLIFHDKINTTYPRKQLFPPIIKLFEISTSYGQSRYTVRKVWRLLRNRLRTTQIKRDV
jgi:hypothetical protein